MMKWQQISHAATVTAGLFLAASIGSASAQSSDPDWLDSLRSQLAIDKKCEVSYFLNITETPSALGMTYAARVACQDGRMFDAIRAEPEPEFKIESCKMSLCETDTSKTGG